MDEQRTAAVERFRLLCRIESGDVPTADAPFALRRGEVCHFGAAAEWRELRPRTVRTDYAGPGAGVRIVRGLRFRVRSVATSRVTRTELTPVDAGRVFFTNRRLVFPGGSAARRSRTPRC